MSGWIWWALGTLGIGGTVLAIAGFTIGWPVVLAFLKTRTGQVVSALVVVGFLIAAAFAKGEASGKLKAAAEREKQRQKAIKTRKQVDDETDDLSDTGVADRLRKWMRD